MQGFHVPALAAALSLAVLATLRLQPQSGLTDEQREILSHLSLVEFDDGLGHMRKAIRVTGINLQIVNGSERTDSANGLGNLILGYNEPGNFFGDVRVGSHNLVAGRANSYRAHGGIVTGEDNSQEGPYASVIGGHRNRAKGAHAAVLGGVAGLAKGAAATIAGGLQNRALGNASMVCGGGGNQADGSQSAILGGSLNVASNLNSTIAGGGENRSVGTNSHVAGGRQNIASGSVSVVCGGHANLADGFFAATVSGGSHNQAGGEAGCTVSGGHQNFAGGHLIDAASVSGGLGNEATAAYATVGGGASRAARRPKDWAAGGLLEED